MKKQTIIAILALVMLFTFNSNASALTLVGWVNPVLDGGSFTTGTATYTFNVGGLPSEGLTSFFLVFPGTAFTSVSSFTELPVIGSWGGSLGGGGVSYSGSISAGSSFSFSVRFTLAGLGTVDPLFNTSAFWGPTNTAWEQNFAAIGSGGSSPPIVGGSTGVTPEPGTLILLGGGLLAVGAVRRVRRKRKKFGNMKI